MLKPSLDRHGRWFSLSCSAVLLATVCGVYIYLYYPVGGVSIGLLRPVPNANNDTHTNAWDPTVQDGVDDGSILLHPEQHVFRDPTTIHMTWNVTLEPRAPDGVTKPVYLINGRFPGPTIEARPGDELVIDVYNSVAKEEGISIHWHGLSMKGTIEMDGVVGVSQCAIGPFESYTYRFRIETNQFGTFWYHAHSGVQRADGLYGGLVVHEPAGNTSRDQRSEHLLLIGDWYHRQADAVFEWYHNPGHFGMQPAPDSLLINGKGSYNCSMAVKAHPVECSLIEKPIVTFAQSDRILLRVVNTGASAGFSFSLGQAPMTVIAVDGGNPVGPDTPSSTLIGLLYAGERMDILVEHPRDSGIASSSEMKGEPGAELSLTIGLDLENFHLTNFALTPKQSFPVLWRGKSEEVQKDAHQQDATGSVTQFNLAQLSGGPVAADVAQKPTDKAVVYTAMSIRSASGLRPVGAVNRTAWLIADPRAPPLLALNRSDWERVTKQPGPVWTLDVPQYQSGENKWMELVVNNPDNQGHVFHLHGYDFYVVSKFQQTQLGFPGTYNPFDLASAPPGGPINTLNPLRKDTVYIPRNGYVVLRFPLANDGLWLLHCHTLWHLASGMGMVIQIGEIGEDIRQRAAALCST
ncbi:multicopper oxidase-domain-containing protein [Talaromyces proteolyticus]|uniref:Multicopper oxidase-domain-containing protein n=1 Tax=Talaromyces proteolyticus TaxID=1131652 RepID=A0AAD4KKC4_9EURO|nr:multicopper oxidase-domain-containing protein [Talaromyces proteolyticus]KAH8690199.1 multicopper oxidase-domain-containing protein [Talaromyces proteolyticus]